MSSAPRYVVMSSSSYVAGARRGFPVSRVALVEVAPGFTGTPSAISPRAPGVARIVRDYGSGGDASLAAAEALKARLEGAIRL